MKRMFIYCEGQTEESFINEVLHPYFSKIGIFVIPVVCVTKVTRTKQYRGGVSDYNKVRNELILLCKQYSKYTITTMFDYYAMPHNTPMIDCDEPDLFKRVGIIEESITRDIGQPNCFFGLMVHEFEALLFSEPKAFSLIAGDRVVRAVQEIRNSAPSPEHINNSPETAPSKRLGKLIPRYAKVKNGTIVAKSIGMEKLMLECSHFAEWIEKIKNC